jgi:hypothetical protein
MEKGTSTSKESLIARLVSTVSHVKEQYGVDIWFAEILGKRWSYIAGSTQGGDSLLPPERIELSERFGLVSDGWSQIPAGEREKIVSSLKEAVKTCAFP